MALGVIGFALLLLIWMALAAFEVVPKQYLSSPQAVVVRLWELLTQYEFIDDIWISIFRVWVAFLLSAVVAIPLGILMSSFRIVNGLTEPIIDFIRYLPVPALVPLTVIWLGIGESSKIALLWMGTFFQLVLLVADDARRVPREYVEVGMTVGARPSQVLRHIILPAMLPNMVDNLRITLGWCWTYLIIAEIVASDSGIGYVIWSARRYVKTPEVMAGILAIGVIGFLTDQFIRWLHRRAFAYLR
jgi:NitT/TauT family transport system permease protein